MEQEEVMVLLKLGANAPALANNNAVDCDGDNATFPTPSNHPITTTMHS